MINISGTINNVTGTITTRLLCLLQLSYQQRQIAPGPHEIWHVNGAVKIMAFLQTVAGDGDTSTGYNMAVGSLIFPLVCSIHPSLTRGWNIYLYLRSEQDCVASFVMFLIFNPSVWEVIIIKMTGGLKCSIWFILESGLLPNCHCVNGWCRQRLWRENRRGNNQWHRWNLTHVLLQ